MAALGPATTNHFYFTWCRALVTRQLGRETLGKWEEDSGSLRNGQYRITHGDHPGPARTRINPAAPMGPAVNDPALSLEYDSAVGCLPAGRSLTKSMSMWTGARRAMSGSSTKTRMVSARPLLPNTERLVGGEAPIPALTCQRLRGSQVAVVPSRTQAAGDSSSDHSQGPGVTKFPSIASRQAGLCAHFITHQLERGSRGWRPGPATTSSLPAQVWSSSTAPSVAHMRTTRITHPGSCCVQCHLPCGDAINARGRESQNRVACNATPRPQP